MCANIAKFKQDLLLGKDKWADNETDPNATEQRDVKVEVKKQDLKNVVKDLKDVMV